MCQKQQQNLQGLVALFEEFLDELVRMSDEAAAQVTAADVVVRDLDAEAGSFTDHCEFKQLKDILPRSQLHLIVGQQAAAKTLAFKIDARREGASTVDAQKLHCTSANSRKMLPRDIAEGIRQAVNKCLVGPISYQKLL